jgi:hypothetical protein
MPKIFRREHRVTYAECAMGNHNSVPHVCTTLAEKPKRLAEELNELLAVYFHKTSRD